MNVPPPTKVRYHTLAEAPEWVAGRRDGCAARCLGVYAYPALWAIAQQGKALVCTYECPRCGHTWWTSWAIDCLDVEFAL